MLQLRNSSPFPAKIFTIPDARGVDTLIVVVKATFELGAETKIAAAPRPVQLADEYWGVPGASSLRTPGEVHLAKPGTDVIVIGCARAPRGQAVTELDVSVRVGDRLALARVHGERVWCEDGGRVVPTPAQPFTEMALVWERAFGGPSEPRNPVGVGTQVTRAPEDMVAHPVPNLDDPRDPLVELGQSRAPVGFAAVAPNWQPRLGYAGTYDEHWRKTQAPYLPEDYDPRQACAASPGLRFELPLVGGEPIVLAGFHPEGSWTLALPACRIDVFASVAGSLHAMLPSLETVILEPDAAIMTITWRACLALPGQLLRVDRVDVGLAELSPGMRGGAGGLAS